MDGNWNRELVREPVVEGLFYPDDGQVLLDGIIKKIRHARSISGESRGIIVPNASFDFSAGHCAEAYKRIAAAKYSRIVILAPCRMECGDSFLLPESTVFKTPAGNSLVDTRALEILISSSTTAEISEISHLQEHGIEVQLPWIQASYPDAKIVPILTDCSSSVGIRALASALQAMEIEEEVPTLYVASINLSPALPRDIAARQAGIFITHLHEGRWEELLAARKRGEIRSAGISVAAVLSLILHRQCRLETLSRGNSYEKDKNDSSVVEYGALSYEHALLSGGSGSDAAN